MKKYVYMALLACGMILLNACEKAEEGTNPGSDKNAVATIYTYDLPKGSDYNPDGSVNLRIVPNQQCDKFYLLTDLVENKEAYIKANGPEAYAEKVVLSGTAYPAADKDLVLEDLFGLYAITVVGVSGNGTVGESREIQFKGIVWKDAGTGTFTYNGIWGGGTDELTLQKAEGEELYRLQIFTNYIRFTIAANGTITAAKQETGEVDSRYGMVSVNTVADPASFRSEDGKTYSFYLQYTVSAGSFGVRGPETFVLD